MRIGAPAGSGTPRCGACGEGHRGARERGRDELDPHLVLYLQSEIHNLYERVVASYLKNAHLEEGDKRWTGRSLARCATQST